MRHFVKKKKVSESWFKQGFFLVLFPDTEHTNFPLHKESHLLWWRTPSNCRHVWMPRLSNSHEPSRSHALTSNQGKICVKRGLQRELFMMFDSFWSWGSWRPQQLTLCHQTCPSAGSARAQDQRQPWHATQQKPSPLQDQALMCNIKGLSSSSPPRTKGYYCFCCCYWYCFPPL